MIQFLWLSSINRRPTGPYQDYQDQSYDNEDVWGDSFDGQGSMEKLRRRDKHVCRRKPKSQGASQDDKTQNPRV